MLQKSSTQREVLIFVKKNPFAYNIIIENFNLKLKKSLSLLNTAI